MNKEQKTAVVEEVASQIQEAEAVFAVDYRGISVPQAAELRAKLTDAGARFSVVKNTLTLLAADRAGAEDLKALLEGPTAFTFVAPETGDVAVVASPITGLVRGLNQLIAGFASQLQQLVDQGLVGGEAPAAQGEEPAPDDAEAAEAEQEAQVE